MPSPAHRSSRDKWLDDQRTIQAFARIEPKAFGISCGVVLGALVFLATAYLLIRGPIGEKEVGGNLSALANVMPGFSVSWVGALVGLAWGFVEGFVVGFLLAGAFNFHHHVYLRLIERGNRQRELLRG